MLPQMEENKKRLIDTLIRGRNSAKRLQNLLRCKVNDDGSVSVDDLVMELLGSLSGGLLLLGSCDSGESCRAPASPHVGLACSVDRAPEVYTGNTGKKPAPAVKERRGGYKGRKNIDSRIKVSRTMEDGYAWRKYGQKKILNSKFPRCYFRCTHKHDHGCKALRQVQELEDESNMFHITYFGRHTCPTPLVFSHSRSGAVLDFKDSKSHHYSPNSPSTITNIHITPSVEQEDDTKSQSDGLSDNVSSANHAQSSPSLVWKEILMNDLGPCHEASSFMGYDYDDSSSSNMDFFKNDGFANDIQLDDVLFF